MGRRGRWVRPSPLELFRLALLDGLPVFSFACAICTSKTNAAGYLTHADGEAAAFCPVSGKQSYYKKPVSGSMIFFVIGEIFFAPGALGQPARSICSMRPRPAPGMAGACCTCTLPRVLFGTIIVSAPAFVNSSLGDAVTKYTTPGSIQGGPGGKMHRMCDKAPGRSGCFFQKCPAAPLPPLRPRPAACAFGLDRTGPVPLI